MAPRCWRLLAVLGLALLIPVVACAQQSPTRTSAPGEPAASAPASLAPAPPVAAPPRRMKMSKTGISPHFWPGYVAAEFGLFEREGIEVEGITLPSSVTQTQALIAGDVNVNNYTVDSMAKAVVAGAPLKFIASAQEVPNIQLIVGHDVRTWADLRGKTVAAGSPGGYYDISLRAMLAANGLREGDYQFRSIAASALRIPALQAGHISAAVMGDRDALITIADGYRSFGFVNEYLKDVQYSGYLVEDGWAKANEDTLVRFLRALLRASDWLFDPANKEEAKRIYGQVSELDAQQQEIVYDQMIVQRMLSRDLRPNLRGLENILNLAVEYGAISEAPPLNTWVDLSYLDKASR